MDEPVSQQEDSEDCTITPAGVWERLDQVTRARVIELFARSAYNFVIAQRRVAVEEDCDVYSRRDTEDHGGPH
jgi:hypothetical protein